tara:strand:- start:1694 stop:2104 length:411 start_codon:yes stop_codon:yes gene_type:complete
MTVRIEVEEQEDKIVANVHLPRYGGSLGVRPIDCRVGVDYVKKRLTEEGYNVGEGSGPFLRNKNGDLNGTYVFLKPTPPKVAPRTVLETQIKKREPEEEKGIKEVSTLETKKATKQNTKNTIKKAPPNPMKRRSES